MIYIHQHPLKAKGYIDLRIAHGGHFENHFDCAYNPRRVPRKYYITKYLTYFEPIFPDII